VAGIQKMKKLLQFRGLGFLQAFHPISGRCCSQSAGAHTLRIATIYVLNVFWKIFMVPSKLVLFLIDLRASIEHLSLL